MQAEMPVESRAGLPSSAEDWYLHGPHSKFISTLWRPGALRSALFDTCQPAGDMSDPPTPDIALVLPLALPGSSNSRVRIDVGAGLFEDQVRENHLFLQPAHAINNVLIDGPHRLLVLSLPLLEANRTLQSSGIAPVQDFGRLHAHYFVDPFIEASLLRLRDWCGPNHASHGLARESLLLTMMLRLAELARSPAVAAFNLAPGGLTRWQTKRVIDRLHADLAASPPLEELAMLVGLSQFHFCRAFKKSLGLSPIQYLIAQRIERAARLLTATQLPIAEIALSVGYEDPAYFTRLFRQKIGVTPSVMRSQTSA